MKYGFLFFVIWFCLAAETSLSGQILRGLVCDESAQPLPSVSIYLKSNPRMWASTGTDGTFVFNPAGTKLTEEEVVIFSFIGYRTVEQQVKNLAGNERLVVRLVEQPILLDGATVTTKVSRKMKNEIKLAFLARFKQQLEKDFPIMNKEYQVVSNAHVAQEGKVLIANEMIGKILEFSRAKRNGSDSLSILQTSVKEYTNPKVKEGVRIFKEKALSEDKKKPEKQSDPAVEAGLAGMDTSKTQITEKILRVHKMLWRDWSHDLTLIIKRLNNPKDWDITYTDTNVILTFKEKTGLLGIAKYEYLLHFVLDRDTYGVERVSESVEAELHIPIGYKLRGEQLDLLKVINIGEREIAKFRLRHAYADIKRNVIYQTARGGKWADEKNLDARVSLLDNKEQALNYNARALAKVIACGVLQ